MVKCKHCCAQITEEKEGVWYGPGIILLDVCLLSPTLSHEPDLEKEEVLEVEDAS